MRGPIAALRRLETREALLLAFFATFIVLAKAALRWHLHVPGHVMFATALFLLLARACVIMMLNLLLKLPLQEILTVSSLSLSKVQMSILKIPKAGQH